MVASPKLSEAIREAAKAELCRRKLSIFVKEFWSTIIPNALHWNWHLDVLCDEIQASDERVFQRLPKLHDLIINVPPGTLKTTVISIMSTAWELARMPELRVFVGSYSDQAVQGIADNIRLVMKSEKYKRYFPNTVIRKDRDSLHNFKTTANGEFYAFTMGGTITSKHADILKVDDPLNPKQAASQKELENANDFFDSTLPTRKVDKQVTPTYLVMQRLADNDPTGHLLKKKGEKIYHICLPATLSENVKPAKYKAQYIDGYLDPVKLGQNALDELKQDLGSARYAGQVDQLPAPKGGLIWKQWFMPVEDAIFPSPEQFSQYGTDWDLAYTEKDTNSASAWVTSGKLNNRMWIDDLGWVYQEFPELIKTMKMHAKPHFIEAKGPGKSAKPTLTKQGIPAIEVQVTGGDKVARAQMATPYPEGGLCYIRKSLLDKLYYDTEQGILNFPFNAKQDLADVLAQAIQRIFKGGMVTSAGKQPSALDYIRPRS